MSKLAMYQELVARRKGCEVCVELKNASRIDDGAFDTDEIGPYANWQGNLNASLMVIGQDFADECSYRRLQGWPGDDVQTNLTLVMLAREAGFDLRAPNRGQSDDVLFFTNAVLCMKVGSMGSPVPSHCFARCAREFLRETVELVNPRAVVTLGVRALRALAEAFSIQEIGPLRVLVEDQPGLALGNGIAVFPRYHPSRRTLSRRTLARQLADWQRIHQWLKAG